MKSTSANLSLTCLTSETFTAFKTENLWSTIEIMLEIEKTLSLCSTPMKGTM